jgi:hypothetical protein
MQEVVRREADETRGGLDGRQGPVPGAINRANPVRTPSETNSRQGIGPAAGAAIGAATPALRPSNTGPSNG